MLSTHGLSAVQQMIRSHFPSEPRPSKVEIQAAKSVEAELEALLTTDETVEEGKTESRPPVVAELD